MNNILDANAILRYLLNDVEEQSKTIEEVINKYAELGLEIQITEWSIPARSETEEGFKVEDFISGPGIVRLYHSFGGNEKIDSARQIDVLRKKDKIACLTYQTFYQEWGKFSANLATAFYATGGIYLCSNLLLI